jgi:hypothetical protein
MHIFLRARLARAESQADPLGALLGPGIRENGLLWLGALLG